MYVFMYICRYMNNSNIMMPFHSLFSFWSICSGETWKVEFQVLFSKYGLDIVWYDSVRMIEIRWQSLRIYAWKDGLVGMFNSVQHVYCISVFACYPKLIAIMSCYNSVYTYSMLHTICVYMVNKQFQS